MDTNNGRLYQVDQETINELNQAFGKRLIAGHAERETLKGERAREAQEALERLRKREDEKTKELLRLAEEGKLREVGKAIPLTARQLREGRVRKLDPCPCGSGKKFSQCCYTGE